MKWKKQIGILFLTIILLIVNNNNAAIVFAEKADIMDKQTSSFVSMEDNLQVKGTNSFGTLLTDTLETEIHKQEENNGCNIFSIEMNNDMATVSFETVQDAVLVVGIYEEDGAAMLATGTLEVTPEQTMAEVKIEIEKMPEYFYLKGFLIDSECMRPLCTAYNSPNYTQEMQEFLAKTTDDFEQDRVLNFDKDTTNNFAVYNENIITILQSNENNIIRADEANNIYVIENINNDILGLQQGNIFVYEYKDGTILIVKVAEIIIDGTTATIKGNETSIDEVFDYVKIDTNSETKDIFVDESTCEEGVVYDGMVEVEEEIENNIPKTYATEGEVGTKWEGKFHFLEKELGDGVKISGNVGVEIETKLKFYLSISYQSVEVKLDYKIRTALEISGESEENSLPLAYFVVSPCPGVSISFTPCIVTEISAKAEISGELSGTIGFFASPQDGARNLTSAPQFKSEFRGEIKVFIGLSLQPKLTFIAEQVAEVELNAKVGVEVTGAVAYSTEPSITSTSTSFHECKFCIDGDIIAKASVGYEAKFLKKKIEATKEFSLKITDFYYSLDYGEFGFASCPHYQYKTTFHILDAEGKALQNAVIDIGGKDITVVEKDGTTKKVTELITDSKGVAVGYLPSGRYSVTVRVSDYLSENKKVKIEDNTKNVLIKMEKLRNEDNNIINMEQTWSSSDEYSGVITQDGSLYMWGMNAWGQVGNGNRKDQLEPVEVLDNVVSIKLGGSTYTHNSYSGAITEDGSLYMWGSNAWGQLGNGNQEDQLTPVKILDNVVSIELSSYFAGVNGAITKDGSLYMWGNNEHGQVGNGSRKDQLIPVKILDNVVSVSLNSDVSGAITKDGSLYMWGYNKNGRVGNGSREDQLRPVKILDNVVSITLSNEIYDKGVNGAITKDGSLYIWGNNNYGQVGNGSKEDQLIPVKILDNIASVALSHYVNGAITKDGSLYMWGSGYGVGNGSKESQLTPIKILDNVESVTLSSDVSGAITKDGSLYMWGENTFFGGIGNGSKENQLTPIKILDNVTSLILNFCSSGAITKDGSLYMWGSNLSGQVGNGNQEDQLIPVKILDNVISIALNKHSGSAYGAITKDRSLYMWGSNNRGEVGNGSRENQLTPVKILDNIKIPSAKQISTVQDPVPSDLYAAMEYYNESAQQADFSDLIPNEVYNFYIMKKRDTANAFNSSNLLYITQAVSDEKGNLSIVYQPTEQAENTDIFVVQKSQIDLSAAQVKVENLKSTGKIQYADPIVTLNGNTLVQGKDYELLGDYSALEVGTYDITIHGIGLYTGKVNASYKVLNELEEVKFADVPEGWMTEPVKYVYAKGIMTGKGKDEQESIKFAPKDTLSREEFAQILYAAEGKPEIIYSNRFSDVTDGNWYTKAILWAAEKGIVSGYANGKFGVGDRISREQLATMLYKYAEYKKYDTTGRQDLTKFTDNTQISGWAVNQLQWAVANAILSGKGSGENVKLDAFGNTTRAECAAMLRTFFVKFVK